MIHVRNFPACLYSRASSRERACSNSTAIRLRLRSSMSRIRKKSSSRLPTSNTCKGAIAGFAAVSTWLPSESSGRSLAVLLRHRPYGLLLFEHEAGDAEAVRLVTDFLHDGRSVPFIVLTEDADEGRLPRSLVPAHGTAWQNRAWMAQHCCAPFTARLRCTVSKSSNTARRSH